MITEQCAQPFIAIEIDHVGNVYTCCPDFINKYKIGSIFTEEDPSLIDIWYSQEACALREKILNGDYSLCNMELCRQRHIDKKIFKVHYCKRPSLPQYITLSYDKECNLKCITCRDNKIKNDKETTELLNKKMDKLIEPLLISSGKTKIVALSGCGEAFYSKHSRQLIKKLANANSDIIFNINTNGLLFNEKNCIHLGIKNRINEVFVSLPALDKKIYNKIMIGSNLDVVLKNIEWMASEMHKQNIKMATINTVISHLNYKELPALVNFAKELDIHITISQYYHWETKFGKKYEEVAVWEKAHKKHREFIEILKSDALNYKRCLFSPLFADLKNSEFQPQKKAFPWF